MLDVEFSSARITNTNVDAFQTALRDQLEPFLRETRRRRRKITVDLHGFDTINDSGLAVLLDIRRKTQKNNQVDIQFTGLSRAIRAKIQVTGLEQPLGLASLHPRSRRNSQ